VVARDIVWHNLYNKENMAVERAERLMRNCRKRGVNAFPGTFRRVEASFKFLDRHCTT